MILSSTTTHALRALVFLASHEEEGSAVQARELARKANIPPHYMSKVLATLTRAGVLAASRGVHGGYRLARPPAKVRLADVVLPFEGARALPGCLLFPARRCGNKGGCSAHGAWGELKAAYARFLESTTLADIMGRRDE